MMAILQDTLLYKGFNDQKAKTIKFTHLLTKNHTNYKSCLLLMNQNMIRAHI